MRIAFLNASGRLGGAEWSLLDRLASLRGSLPGWDLRLIVPEAGPLLEEAEGLGVRTSVLPFPPLLASLGDSRLRDRGTGRAALVGRALAAGPATARYLRALRRALAGIAPDVVHSYGLKTHVLGVWAAPRVAPVLWNVQDYPSLRPVMAPLLRRHASRAAAAICCSRSVSEDVRAVCGEILPVHTVYNAVDLSRFSPEGAMAELDALASLPPDWEGIRIGLVATMARWKGHETFIRALCLLPSGIPVRGYVIGGPVYETSGSQRSIAELREVASRLGVVDRVGFTGMMGNTADALRALDIVVHASTEPEPFGRVVAEAMACGRAVVASDAGGAAEIVTPEVDALVHTPGDAQALAERLARLVRDPELRARLGRAGVETARQRFDRARLATELAPIYSAVLGRSASGPPAHLAGE